MVGPLLQKGSLKTKITRSSKAAKAPSNALVYHRGHGYFSLYTGKQKSGNIDRKRKARTRITKAQARKYGHKGDVSRKKGL